jgi:hypothetical protein
MRAVRIVRIERVGRVVPRIPILRVGRVIPRALARNSCLISTGGNVDTTRPTLTIITIHTTGQPLQPTHPRIIHRIFGRVGLTIPILVLYLSESKRIPVRSSPIIITVGSARIAWVWLVLPAARPGCATRGGADCNGYSDYEIGAASAFPLVGFPLPAPIPWKLLKYITQPEKVKKNFTCPTHALTVSRAGKGDESWR